MLGAAGHRLALFPGGTGSPVTPAAPRGIRGGLAGSLARVRNDRRYRCVTLSRRIKRRACLARGRFTSQVLLDGRPPGGLAIILLNQVSVIS